MAESDGDWDSIYRTTREESLPWFSPTLDSDTNGLLRRLRVGPQDGPVLDVGTGPGTFAIEMAKRHFQVVAADISEHAIQMAMRRAGGFAPHIEWVRADLFDCKWPNRFQLIHDRGVYHSLPEDKRHDYARLVPTWLRPRGYLVLKTFHQDEPGDWGPHRISKTELTRNFASQLDTVEIAPATFPNTMGTETKAWRAVFRARSPSP